MSFDITKYRLNPDLRFKNLDKFLSPSAKQFYNKNNIIRLTKLVTPGSLVSSVEFNEFAADIKFNNKNLYNIIFELDKEISRSENKLRLVAENLSINLFNYKQESKLLKDRFFSNIKLQLFNFTSNLGNYVYDSFANYDDVAKTHLDNNHCYLIKGAGLTSSVKELKKNKPINIFYDLSDSTIGEIQYQSSYEDWKEESIFWINFWNKFISNSERSIPELSMWFELGGYQEINNISFNTVTPLSIESISYLDHNENEITLDYKSYNYNYIYNIIFNNISTNLIKIKFKLIGNFEQGVYENVYGKMFTFYIRDVLLNKYSFNDIGYATLKLDSKFKGIKITNDFHSDSFSLFTYLKIKYQRYGRQLEETIPLYENYYYPITIIPYFVNKTFTLDYYPTDDLSLYKNDSELILGTDYNFIVNDTATTTIPAYTGSSISNVAIELVNYDSIAKYTIRYTPDPVAYIKKYFTYNYDYLNFDTIFNNMTAYIQYIFRRKNSSVEDFPLLTFSKVVLNES